MSIDVPNISAPTERVSAPPADPAVSDAMAAVAGQERRRIRSGRIGSVVMTLSSFTVAILAWQGLVWLLDIPSYTLPAPADVWSTTLSSRELLIRQSWPTIQEIAMGFGLSVVVGIPLGISIIEFKWFGRFIEPLIVASQAVPKIAVAPLFVVWWGFGMTPKVLIAFLIAFFPVVVATTVGLRGVSGELIDLGRSMGAGRLTLLRRIKLPGAQPSIFGGLRVAMTLAVIGAVVGEFVGADEGLGRLIVVANGRLHTELVFAAVVVLTLLGVGAYKLVEVSERLLIPWHREKTALTSGDSG